MDSVRFPEDKTKHAGAKNASLAMLNIRVRLPGGHRGGERLGGGNTGEDKDAALHCLFGGKYLYFFQVGVDFRFARNVGTPANFFGPCHISVAPKVHRSRARSPLAGPEPGRRAGRAKTAPKQQFPRGGARRALCIVRAGRQFWEIV